MRTLYGSDVARSSIETWKRGKLRVFVRVGGALAGGRDSSTGQPFEREFEAIGNGWAILADRPFVYELANGVRLDFDLRDGAMACIAVRAPEGKGLTTKLLREVEPLARQLRMQAVNDTTVRLIVLDDGTIAAEQPWAQPTAERPYAWFGEPAPEVAAEDRRRRSPMTDERLRRVADLYREAEQLNLPRTKHIAREFPHYTDAAIRNWVRHARARGFLEKGEKNG